MSETMWTAERPVSGVVVHQPRRGFRYGAEAFWLAGVALEDGRPARALDLGTGSGIVGWLLASVGVEVVGVDVRAEWATGWAASARDSEVSGRFSPHVADVDAVEGNWPLVVSNPPFFAVGSGPMPPDPWTAAARFEQEGTVDRFVTAGAARLTEDGRMVVVVPCDREGDVVTAARAVGLAPSRVVEVGKRRVVLVLRRGAGDGVREQVTEGSAREAAWYAAVGARPRGGA